MMIIIIITAQVVICMGRRPRRNKVTWAHTHSQQRREVTLCITIARAAVGRAMRCDVVGITHISVRGEREERSRRGIAVFAPRELSADRHYFYTLSSQRQRAAGRWLMSALNASD